VGTPRPRRRTNRSAWILLKDCGTKDKILKECAELFYHENFEQTLDEKTHLGAGRISFEKRKTCPCGTSHGLATRCLTRSMTSLQGFSNKDMREYAGRFANFISGDVSREEFYIFTGSGSNGSKRLNSSRHLLELQTTDFATDAEASCCRHSSGELTRTKARRFCVLQGRGGEKLNVGIMKELSGGDRSMPSPLRISHRV
jgi:hypothetical protein